MNSTDRTPLLENTSFQTYLTVVMNISLMLLDRSQQDWLPIHQNGLNK